MKRHFIVLILFSFVFAVSADATSMDYRACWKTVEKEVTKDVMIQSLAYVGTIEGDSKDTVYHIFNLVAAVNCMLSPRGLNGIYFLNFDCSKVIGTEKFQSDAIAYRVEGKAVFLSQVDNNYHLIGPDGKGKGAPNEGNALDLHSGWKNRQLFYKFDYGVTGGSVLEKNDKNTKKKELDEYLGKFCKGNK